MATRLQREAKQRAAASPPSRAQIISALLAAVLVGAGGVTAWILYRAHVPQDSARHWAGPVAAACTAVGAIWTILTLVGYSLPLKFDAAAMRLRHGFGGTWRVNGAVGTVTAVRRDSQTTIPGWTSYTHDRSWGSVTNSDPITVTRESTIVTLRDSSGDSGQFAIPGHHSDVRHGDLACVITLDDEVAGIYDQTAGDAWIIAVPNPMLKATGALFGLTALALANAAFLSHSRTIWIDAFWGGAGLIGLFAIAAGVEGLHSWQLRRQMKIVGEEAIGPAPGADSRAPLSPFRGGAPIRRATLLVIALLVATGVGVALELHRSPSSNTRTLRFTFVDFEASCRNETCVDSVGPMSQIVGNADGSPIRSVDAGDGVDGIAQLRDGSSIPICSHSIAIQVPNTVKRLTISVLGAEQTEGPLTWTHQQLVADSWQPEMDLGCPPKITAHRC